MTADSPREPAPPAASPPAEHDPRVVPAGGTAEAVARPKGRIERLEEAVGIGFFLVMFVTVCTGVIWRYVLRQPLVWTNNLATIGFIWVVLVGAGLPNWDDEHIQFELLYERLSDRLRRGARILGNLLIIVPFGLAVPGTVDYLRFVHEDRVTGLPLPFSLAYGGILVFLVSTILHRGRLLLRDLRGGPEGERGGDAA